MQPDDDARPGATPVAILETVLYADDLDAAERFYQHVVGLTLVSSEPDRHRFFRVGDGMLLIFAPASTRSSTVTVGDQRIPRHGATGAGHMAFRAAPEQISAIRENLMTHGVAIESEIRWPKGGESIYCRDPAGNSIEFATADLWFHDEP